MPISLHGGRETQRRHAVPNPALPPLSRQAAPKISRPLLAWFARYAEYYLQKHFHGLFLSGQPPEFSAGGPWVVYLNHAGWWDPLACLCASRHLSWNHQNYAPIDAQALQQFGFFRKLGFFPVEKGTPRGAVNFLNVAGNLLADPQTILWITPQGDFVDQRQRPVLLKGGIAHLAQRIPNVRFVPLAIDYFFGEERLPGAAMRFGAPVASPSLHELEAALEQTMDQLAAEVLSRNIKFSPRLVGGRTGTGGIYGLWQRIRGQ